MFKIMDVTTGIRMPEQITDMNQILLTEPGTYEGIDIIGSPADGHVIIDVIVDSHGNADITLKDDTSRTYEGGVPNGGSLYFNNVSPNHFHGVDDPLDALGEDGDIYFKIP